MDQVFAGFICGYALALVSAPVLAIALLRLRTESRLLNAVLPPGTPVVALVVALHGALFFFWTAIGMILGLILGAMRHAGGGLGSANFAFTLLVASLTLALVAPVAIAWQRMRRPVLIAALVVLLTFGWLMPYMARWSNFGSS